MFAIAAGVATGMGLGMNTKAALVTRGCLEMTKIALAMGARLFFFSNYFEIGHINLCILFLSLLFKSGDSIRTFGNG